MRAGFLLALLGLALTAGPAQADDLAPANPGCDGAVAPARPASRVDEAIAFRRDYTLRADRAFVAEVERSSAARARGARRGYPAALTPSEARYFARRDRVQAVADRIVPFERANRRILGGVSIEDDFRGGPYIKVRLAVARPARFLPRLRRLLRVRVRVARVRYSERALRRVQDRLGVLFDRPLAGVHVGSSSVDIDANRAVVEVATRRTDVQAEVTRRFGPAARVDVVAADPIAIVCTALREVQAAADDRDLTLRWSDSGSIDLERAVVEETGDVVRVGVLTRVPTVGGITADLESKSTVVRLAAPLGTRRVVDAETGRPLPVRRP